MVRKTIMTLIGVATLVMFGLLNIGVVGCGGGGNTADVSTIKTAPCTDYPDAFETTVNLEAIKGMMPDNDASNEVKDMLPDDLTICFNNLGALEEDNGIGIGWSVEVPKIPDIIPVAFDFDLKVFELTASPKESEVSEDISLDDAVQSVAMQFSNELVADAFDILDPLITDTEDKAEVAEVEVLIEAIAKEYFKGFSCAVESSCSEMNDAETGFTLACETADLDLYTVVEDVLNGMPDAELATFLGSIDVTKSEFLAYWKDEDNNHITIPAGKFDFELKPVESCNIMTKIAGQLNLSDDEEDGADQNLYYTGKTLTQPEGADPADCEQLDVRFEDYIKVDIGSNNTGGIYTAALEADIVDRSLQLYFNHPITFEENGDGHGYTLEIDENNLLLKNFINESYWCQADVQIGDSIIFNCRSVDVVLTVPGGDFEGIDFYGTAEDRCTFTYSTSVDIE